MLALRHRLEAVLQQPPKASSTGAAHVRQPEYRAALGRIERRIKIVADRGIARRVAQETWQAISDGLAQALQSGHHERGLLDAVDQVHTLRKDHFVLMPGANNPNELGNRPEVR